MNEVTLLRDEVATLRDEVAHLRKMLADVLAAREGGFAGPAAAEGVSEDTLFTIAAAVAAYLGKRATIKMVRPVPQSLDGWRLQGRVAVQGSHAVR
ncbi:MAG: hypothetical protein KIS66_14060 [Fimbriimonadaceae bacterium]|nr:hypothetical protein [Fimbriimonadaceae bacterium]